MRTPEEIIGRDALLQLTFEGYEVVPYVAAPLLPMDDGFDEFWAKYPKHVGKPAALKAYKSARKRRASHADIMAGVDRLVESHPDPQFTPHPSTWLNQDRWNDTPTPKQMSDIDAARERLRQKVQDEQQRTGDREFGDRGAVGLRLGVGPQRAQHQQLRLMPR